MVTTSVVFVMLFVMSFSATHDAALDLNVDDDVKLGMQELFRRMDRLEKEKVSLVWTKDNSTEELEARVEQLEISVQNLDERLDTVEIEVTDNENDIIGLLNSVDDLQDQAALHEEDISVLQSDSSDLQDAVTDLQDADVQLDERVSNLESSIGSNNTALEARVEILEFNVSRHDVLIGQLQAADSDLEQRVTDLEETVIEPFNACESSPCENGATCVDVNVDIFICVCRDGYFGLTCSESYSGTMFMAALSGANQTPSNPIVFDDAHINPGGHYDNATGIYTVPLDGVYEFNVQVSSDPDASWFIYIHVDDNDVAVLGSESGASGYLSNSMHVTLHLVAEQEVWIVPFSLDYVYGTEEDGTMVSWFSGRLINAD